MKSKKIVVNILILVIGLLTVVSQAWAQQTVTHKDAFGRTEWSIYFPADATQNATGTHYLYSNPQSTSTVQYAREKVQFSIGFRPTDYPGNNYLVTSKTYFDMHGRTEWVISFPLDSLKNATGTHYIYSDPQSSSTTQYARETVQFTFGFTSMNYPGNNYLVTSKTYFDMHGRTEWVISFPLDSLKNATGTHYMYSDPQGTSTSKYAIETVQFMFGFTSMNYPGNNYLVTSKSYYNTAGRIEWIITFPTDPTKNATGTHYLYSDPQSVFSTQYARETVQFMFGFTSMNYPGNNYIVTSKTYYDTNGRTEWVIKFPTDSTKSPSGTHTVYSSTGTIAISEVVRFPVTYRSTDYPQSGFYTVTAINYFNARGQTEWVVNFPNDPNSNPTGYRFHYDMAGTFKKLDTLVYNRHAPTTTIPYMQYTITSSQKY